MLAFCFIVAKKGLINVLFGTLHEDGMLDIKTWLEIKWTKKCEKFLAWIVDTSCIVIRRRGFLKLITKSLEFLNYDEWFILEVSRMGMVLNSSRCTFIDLINFGFHRNILWVWIIENCECTSYNTYLPLILSILKWITKLLVFLLMLLRNII